MRIGLAVYGTTFGMGIDPASKRPTITPKQLLDKAKSLGLEGVELPAFLMKGEDATSIANYAREQSLFITLETEGYDPNKLATAINLGVELDAKTIRTIVGGAKLGGDRRPLAGRWQSFLHEILAGLKEATTIAERAGVNLALENHQDLTSEELLWLCEVNRVTKVRHHFGYRKHPCYSRRACGFCQKSCALREKCPFKGLPDLHVRRGISSCALPSWSRSCRLPDSFRDFFGNLSRGHHVYRTRCIGSPSCTCTCR